MRQTFAIFLDAYRELNAKKLFWITMILSGLVVAVMGAMGINDKGFTFLHWNLEFGPTTMFMSKEMFYKQMLFVGLGVKFWLGAIATVLAIVSTASMVPDMISSGSIDLALSKPISRTRLFLTKYLAGLLFAGLQVTVFSVIAFLIIGLRAGSWEPKILLAIPIVTLFFSYLFCILVFFGLVTRSTIASMMLTLLVWGASFLLTLGDSGIALGREINAQRETVITTRYERKAAEIETLKKSAELTTDRMVKLPLAESSLKRLAERKENATWWHTLFRRLEMGSYAVKTVLPKVSETKDLLERSLLTEKEYDELVRAEPRPEVPDVSEDDFRIDEGQVQKRMVERKLSQPLWWVLGTSLLFEIFVVAVCCRIFARRDF